MPYRTAGERPKTGRCCPRCGADLVAETLGPNTIERCPGCRGLWIAAKEFNELLLDLDRQEAVRELEEPHFDRTVEKGYLKCPHCSATMVRTNFDRHSGIIVDTCRKHGVWLDRGELRSVVGYLTKRMEETIKAREEGVIRTKGADPDAPFTTMPQVDSWYYDVFAKNSLIGMIIELLR